MTQGEYFKSMSFHRIAVTNAEREKELRTDEWFRERYQPEHHLTRSVLEDLPIDMVKQFIVADSLHLIDLGAMKRLLYRWMGLLKSRQRLWPEHLIVKISKILVQYNQTLPTEIHRKIRPLKSIHFWKASEFRTIILYVGIVLLKDNVPRQEYELFLKLFCAISICSTKMYITYLPLARTLFTEYIEGHITVYGIDSITSNIHNLSHVVDDVEMFGELNTISAYEFENCLHLMKLLVKQCNKPLEQLARRLHENSLMIFETKSNEDMYPKVKDQFSYLNGPDNFLGFKSIQLKSNFMLKNDEKNQWVMLNDADRTIVRFEYAFKKNNHFFFHGYPLNSALKENFFIRPFNSSHINIFLYEIVECDVKNFNINQIMAKLFRLPYQEKSVFIPLLHTL